MTMEDDRTRAVLDGQLQRIGDEIVRGIPSSWKYVLILHEGDCEGPTTWLSNTKSQAGALWLMDVCALSITKARG